MLTSPDPRFNRFVAQNNSESNAGQPASDDSLAETARQEQEYLRDKLREELGREPTEQEADEWLRRHTEGY